MVTVVMNRTDEPIEYKLYVGMDAVRLTIQPHAMQSLLY